MPQPGAFRDGGDAAAHLQGVDGVALPGQLHSGAAQAAACRADAYGPGAASVFALHVIPHGRISRQAARQVQRLIFGHDQEAVRPFHNDLAAQRRIGGNARRIQRPPHDVHLLCQVCDGYVLSRVDVNIAVVIASA